MDETQFEAWLQSHEFATTSIPKAVKLVWKQLVEEFDIDDENVYQIVEKLFSLGEKNA